MGPTTRSTVDAAGAKLALQQLEGELFGVAALGGVVVATNLGDHAVFLGALRLDRIGGRRGHRLGVASRLAGADRRRPRQSTPSASLRASRMTSALRCSVSRLASGADFMGEHQGSVLDRAYDGPGQHHLGGAAALTDLVADC